MMAVQHARQYRQMRRDVRSSQGSLFKAQYLRGGFIGELHFARAVDRQDGQRAGFDQGAQFGLGILTQADLRFQLR